jgi:hypothetical protein
MPTNTDLVTDLPADFEVFGQAVDTSLADLKGGTTGQILSKATNTDMDFVWITNDQGDITGITATSPLTGGGTSGAVTVGIQSASTSQSGAVQLSDSTSTTSSVLAATPTAVKSAYDLANRPNPSNPVLNSAFQVWQRGTTSTAIGSGTFLADRWQAARTGFAAGASQSQQATGDTTNLPNIQYCLRAGRDTGNTSTASVIVGQNIETVNSIPFAGKTVTLSFYARKGALYSGSSNLLALDFASGTGTNQNLVTAGTLTGINNTSTTFTLTTTWQRFTVTKAIDSTATQLAFQYSYVPVGTAGATDYFEFTGVQIDIGSVALPFRTTGVSYQQELAACQRYYAKSYSQATAPATNSSANGLVFAQSGATIASTDYICNVPLPVTMRANPTVTIYSFTSSTTGKVSDGSGTDLAAGSGATNLINDSRFTVQNNAGVSITAAKNGVVFHYTASAEL